MNDMYEPEIRHGRWQDVSDGIMADAVICDPPYGSRTHENTVQRADSGRDDGCAVSGLSPKYTCFTPDDVREFITEWHEFCRGWMVALTSHDLLDAYRAAFEEVGRYVFQPLLCVIRGMSCRLHGDGPSSGGVYAMVARPRNNEFAKWGTLPGYYVGNQSRESGGGRGKPDWLMQALVRDYSRPGDLVVDPFCGWGSTLIAARALGRRSIGIDVDAEALSETRRRLGRPAQGGLFA